MRAGLWRDRAGQRGGDRAQTVLPLAGLASSEPLLPRADPRPPQAGSRALGKAWRCRRRCTGLVQSERLRPQPALAGQS